MSEQKPSHELEGIVREAQRQDCVEAQIWGRVPKNACTIDTVKQRLNKTNKKGPQEHQAFMVEWPGGSHSSVKGT